MTHHPLLKSLSESELRAAAQEALTWAATGRREGAALMALASRLQEMEPGNPKDLLDQAESLVYREVARRFAQSCTIPLPLLAETAELLSCAEPSATQIRADIGMCAQWDVDALRVTNALNALLQDNPVPGQDNGCAPGNA